MQGVPSPVAPKTKYSPFQVEVYDSTIEEKEEERHKIFVEQYESNVLHHPIWVETYQELVDDYKAKAEKIWWRIDSSGKKQPAILPTKTQCKEKSNIKGYHSLLQVLPEKTESVIIIPPVKGNLLLFQKHLQFLLDSGALSTNSEKDLLVKENTVIICMTPFFDIQSIEQRALFYSALLLLNWNPGKFYILRDENAIELGCKFYEGIDARENQGKDILPNFLFPSFLIYPYPFGKYEGLLFSNKQEKGISAIVNSRFKPLTNIRESVAFPTGINPEPFFSKYFTINTQGVPSTAPSARLDIPICKTLDTIFYDVDITKDIYTITSGKKIYVIRLGKIKQNPFLCTDENGNIQGLLPNPGSFKGDEANPEYAPGESSVTVLIDGIPRKFRMPTEVNKVRENWEKGIYSNSEVAFLNYLNLTPILLSQIFMSMGDENTWKRETAKFLENLVASKCFEDTSILTAARCEDTRSFLNTIVQYFFMSTTDDSDMGPLKRLGAPKPSAPPLEEDRKPFTSLPTPISTSLEQITPIEWPQGLIPLESGKEFEKETFGDLEFETDLKKNKYYFDLIVLHKKSGEYKFMRMVIDKERLKESQKTTMIAGESQIFEALEELKRKYSDFVFIY